METCKIDVFAVIKGASRVLPVRPVPPDHWIPCNCIFHRYQRFLPKEPLRMLSDPITLYKLMILYMLDHVNFPLTNSQLTDFFLDHEYTTYFTLQQALNELKEAGLIRMESTHNSSRYEITKEGDDTLSFFRKQYLPGDHRGISTAT